MTEQIERPPILKQVIYLLEDELFIWDRQPEYLHRARGILDRDKDCKFYADHIATRDEDGTWRILKPGIGNMWNPYCMVRVVSIQVV